MVGFCLVTGTTSPPRGGSVVAGAAGSSVFRRRGNAVVRFSTQWSAALCSAGGSLCDGRSMHRTPLRGRIERVLKHGNAHGSSVAEWHQEKQKAFRSLPDGSVPRCQFKGRQSSCILLAQLWWIWWWIWIRNILLTHSPRQVHLSETKPTRSLVRFVEL